MSQALSEPDIKKSLTELDGWSWERDCLWTEVTFNDFKEAMSFLVYVGMIAEERQHHPEIHNIYNRVRVALSTHDAGDKVTQKDVDMAHHIQKLLEG